MIFLSQEYRNAVDMKTWKIVITLFILFAVAGSGYGLAQVTSRTTGEPVTIPDLALREAICSSLSLPASKITASVLSDLTVIEIHSNSDQPSEENVADLRGLEYCNNLTELFISSSVVTDISPIKDLSRLRKLHLVGEVEDLSPLSNLISLQELYLGGKLVDISPIGDLVGLKTLALVNSNIEDISALSELVNLENLSLSFNYINDLSPLASLFKLNSLNLSQNNISDISILSELVNLKDLALINNEITNIFSLYHLNKLRVLNLDLNSISDISGLANMVSLETITLTDNEVTDISSLEFLDIITELDISKNNIQDISMLDDKLWRTDSNTCSLCVSDNPLNEESLYVTIPRLRQAGVKVAY